YTWSKAMDATTFLNPSDPLPYRSLSDSDRAQRITGSGIWELPFGKGRKFGAQMPKGLEFFAGGWQLAGAWQRQSGQPIGWGRGPAGRVGTGGVHRGFAAACTALRSAQHR